MAKDKKLSISEQVDDVSEEIINLSRELESLINKNLSKKLRKLNFSFEEIIKILDANIANMNNVLSSMKNVQNIVTNFHLNKEQDRIKAPSPDDSPEESSEESSTR